MRKPAMYHRYAVITGFPRKGSINGSIEIAHEIKNPTSLLDRSRRQKGSPNETKQKRQKPIKDLRKRTKFCPDRLSCFLRTDHRKSVHRSTIYAILKRKDLIKKPSRKRKNAYKLYTKSSRISNFHLKYSIKMQVV